MGAEADRQVAIVLYDGECGLCSRVVQFILRRDRRHRFQFASLQGNYARELLRRYGLEQEPLSTMYLVRHPGTPEQRLDARASAAVQVLVGLGGIWRIAMPLLWLPRWLLDPFHNLVARNRHRFASAVCITRRPEDASRFLD